MRLRGMRLLVHRGQVLLLLVVGLLTGIAFAGVCLEMTGVSISRLLQANELFAPARPALPAQIVIGAAVRPSDDSGLGASGTANAVPAVARPASSATAAPSPTTAVVAGNVYAYPPGEHGGGPGGGSGSGHGGRGG